jgi:thioredoxin 2
MESVLLRCSQCGAINKVSMEYIHSNLKCGSCKTLLNVPTKPVDISSSNFHQEIERWPGTVLLDYWSPTCVFCKQLSPILDQIAADKAGILKIAKINTQAEQHLAVEAGIQGVPTLMLYQNGRKIGEIPGALPREQLLAWISQTAGV